MDKTCPECGARVHLGGYTIEKHENELEYVAFEKCGAAECDYSWEVYRTTDAQAFQDFLWGAGRLAEAGD